MKKFYQRYTLNSMRVEENIVLEESEYYNRVECPMCGNNNPKHIQEVDNLRKPLYFFKNGKKPMYAKMYHCTDCRYEWDK